MQWISKELEYLQIYHGKHVIAEQKTDGREPLQ